MSSDWDDVLARFAEAPPALLERREMGRRTESKFAMPVRAATALLHGLPSDYAVLRAGSALVAAYRTLYFDTEDLEFFHAHRSGRRIRHKVRIRHYPDRAVSFLEIKTRLGADQSTKARRPRPYGDSELCPGDVDFIRVHAAGERALHPQAWIDFRRVTLLGLAMEERVTLDLDLRVTAAGRTESLPDLAVVEVKQPRLDRGSVAMVALGRAGWREGWASKYCLAIGLTRPEVGVSRLWPEQRGLTRAAG